jgi:molecular chaperone DnaK (HSP70)
MKAKKIIGIDLGTTYSCMAYVNDSGKTEIIPNFSGKLVTPSAVYFEAESGNVIVGEGAKRYAKLYPMRVFECFKRDMGQMDKDGKKQEWEVDNKTYTPEALSSLLLRKMVDDASEALGEKITEVVITCPAYFGSNERKATEDAGSMAGLNVRHILNEPTAAAYYYGLLRTGTGAGEETAGAAPGSGRQVVLVYDLGGGTFDVTLIEISGGNVEVIYTDGKRKLGGRDWDERIVMWLVEEFQKQYPDKGDPMEDPETVGGLWEEAEEAKIILSGAEKDPMSVAHAGVRVRTSLTRTIFQERTKDLLDETINYTRRALEEGKKRLLERAGEGAGEAANRVDLVLLVGGSSMMPAVAQRLTQEFGLPLKMHDPHLAVARGAALVAMKIMAGEAIREVIAAQTGVRPEEVNMEAQPKEVIEAAATTAVQSGAVPLTLPGKEVASMATGTLRNVSSKAFGVKVGSLDRSGDYVHFLIHANTALPAAQPEVFGTRIENQEWVVIQIMEQAGQVESKLLTDNILLTSGEIGPLPPGLPAGSDVEVVFRLEEDGTLKVTAREPKSGKGLELKADVSSAMTKAEIERAKEILMEMKVSG